MRIRMITDQGNWYRAWDGSVFRSDIVRSAIRPKAKAIGKLAALHVRESAEKMQINPEPYMRLLLEEPNPYSSGQMLRERMATLLAINNNAFAAIIRDEDGFPAQLYVLPAVSAEAIRGEGGRLYIKFQLAVGETKTLPYGDVIHLRDDYSDNDVFGAPKADVLLPLLEIVSASDQSIINAVKRSAVIRWIMRFKNRLRPEDLKDEVDRFVENYLSAESRGGAVPADTAYDLDQVKENHYVPASPHQQRAIERIHALFGTNSKIVQADYDEDEWQAYFESEVEPLAQQMSQEFTRKLFTRRERGFGNRIIFDATSLSYASMKTKLGLVHMVDRGGLSINEWRRVLNMPPVEGGDERVRRLDTAVVEDGGDSGGSDDQNMALDSRSGLWLPSNRR